MRNLLLITLLLLSTLVSAQIVTQVKFEVADSKTEEVLNRTTYKMHAQLKYSMPDNIGEHGYIATPKEDGSPYIQTFKVLQADRKDDYIIVSSQITTKGNTLPSYITFIFSDVLELIMISEIDSFKGVTYYTTFFIQ